MPITRKSFAVVGAGLVALSAGTVLLFAGSAGATSTGPVGGSGATLTTSVPADATVPPQSDDVRPTATVRPGETYAQDPGAPVVVTRSAAPGSTEPHGAQPTATVTATSSR